MAAEWFYSTNEQEMGPVSWEELRELAQGGILKPRDKVWTDGMAEWVKAADQEGLFADHGADGAKIKAKAPKPPPLRRQKRATRDDDDDDDGADTGARRPARQKRAKSGAGLLIGLIAGGAALALLLLVAIGVGAWAILGVNRDMKGRNDAVAKVGELPPKRIDVVDVPVGKKPPAPVNNLPAVQNLAPRGKSPLNRLDPKELTPVERDELPPDTVAVLRGQGGHYLVAAFTPDSTRAALGTSDGGIEIWDLQGTKPRRQASLSADKVIGPIYKLAFSADAKYLATVHGMTGGTIVLWQMTKDGANFVQKNQALGRIDDVVFHPNNRLLVCGSNTGKLLSLTNNVLQPLPNEFRGANSQFTFTPDGKFAAVFFTPERNGEFYGSEVMFWNLGENLQINEYLKIQQERSIKALAVSRNGKWLATGSTDKQVRLWDLTQNPPTAENAFTMPAWARSLHMTPDSQYLVGFSSQAHIVLWNIAGRKQEKSWQFTPRMNGPFGTGAMYRLFSATALAPDGSHILFSNHTSNAVILRLPIDR